MKSQMRIRVHKEVGFDIYGDEMAEALSHASSTAQADFFNALAEYLDEACNATGGMNAQLVFVAPELSPLAVEMLKSLVWFVENTTEEDDGKEEAPEA